MSTDQRVYAYWKSMCKTIRSNGGHIKHNAVMATAQKFKIPCSEVRRIINPQKGTRT